MNYFVAGIGYGTLEFSYYIVLGVEDTDDGVFVGVGFAHLLCRVLQGHYLCAFFGYISLGDNEGFTVDLIEAPRYITAKLEVLFLIYSDGDKLRLVKEYICRHKRRIGKEPCVYIVRIFCALVLKLRHSRKLAKHSIAIEYPAKLRMGGNVALYEKRIFLRVKAAGYIKR